MSKKIFLSYCWNDKKEVEILDNLFNRFGIKVTRDIRDLAYNTNIHNFMNTIKDHDKIILFVSNSYLKSVNCMYEASQVIDTKDKVIIIMKEGTNVYSPDNKKDLITYWKNELLNISNEDPILFKEEIEDTKTAYKTISNFIDFIKKSNRMNEKTLDFDVLLEQLGIKKNYPNIINNLVYKWISNNSKHTCLSTINSLIVDLYNSKQLKISEYPNIPDNEKYFKFTNIEFVGEANDMSLILRYADKDGKTYSKSYDHLTNIEHNTIRSDHHSKYYFYCENLSKKQTHLDLSFTKEYENLNDEEMKIYLDGYEDTYRLTIYF